MVYNAETTAEAIALDSREQIANKVVLVTGTSPNGLGAYFCTAIAAHGPAMIILASYSKDRAGKVAAQIAEIAPNVETHTVQLDLVSQAQVREAAAEILSISTDIDVIVNNAGIMAKPYALSPDGIESHFATNHIGHFLLTNLLLSKLLEGERKKPLRVVSVASNGFMIGHGIRFEDINYGDGATYNRWKAYGQSKTANMLFALSLAKKLGHRGVQAFSLHPGVIGTELSRDLAANDFVELVQIAKELGLMTLWGPSGEPNYTDFPRGTATHVLAAFHPSLDAPELNGAYLTGSQVVPNENVCCWGRDAIDAEKLWKMSEELVKQKFPF